MQNKTLILISSGNRCGKDTTANRLLERISNLGKKALIVPLAEYLKNDVSGLLGVTTDELDILKNNKEVLTIGKRSITTRDFIEEHALKVMKLTNNDYYIHRTMDTIRNTNHEYIIIPDLRYRNEYAYFNNLKNIVHFIDLISNIDNCEDVSLINDLQFDHTFVNKQDDISILNLHIENFITNHIISSN